jgi:hypothetical protein
MGGRPSGRCNRVKAKAGGAAAIFIATCGNLAIRRVDAAADVMIAALVAVVSTGRTPECVAHLAIFDNALLLHGGIGVFALSRSLRFKRISDGRHMAAAKSVRQRRQVGGGAALHASVLVAIVVVLS